MLGRHSETKCKFVIAVSVCARHFIIRNVIKASDGFRAFYYFVVIIVCVCALACDCIDKAKRSRYDLLR